MIVKKINCFFILLKYFYWGNFFGRDIRIRTRTSGFGDRYATIDIISLHLQVGCMVRVTGFEPARLSARS